MTKAELVEKLSGLGCDDLDQLKNDSLEAIVALQDERDALTELNNQLNDKLTTAEASASASNPTFKVGEDTYELVVASSSYKGKTVNAAFLKANPDVLKKLVDIGAGILRKVEK